MWAHTFVKGCTFLLDVLHVLICELFLFRYKHNIIPIHSLWKEADVANQLARQHV